jgi:hypothetical protein
MGNWEGGVRQWMRVASLILSLAVVVSTSVLNAPTRGEAAPPTKEEIAEEKKEIRQKAREILTEAGLALELTAKGTKYYKDGDLN